MMLAWRVFWVFFKISVISFGGVFGVLPEMERLVVGHYHWLTHDQFMHAFVLSQFLPGPNMVMCPLIGYWVAGVPGLAAGFFGIYAAPVAMVSAFAMAYRKLRNFNWVRRIEFAMRPMVIGLLAASALRMALEQSRGARLSALILICGAAFFSMTRKVSPLLIVSACGAIWWVLCLQLA